MQKFPDAKRILVINLGGLGDVLLSMPSLKILCNSYNQSKISLLTIPRASGLLEDFCFIDEVISFRGGFIAKFKLLLKLGKVGFDVAINIRPLTSAVSSIKMALLFYLINAKYRIGRDTEKRGFFLDIKVPDYDKPTMHDLDYYFYMLESLGLETGERNIELNIRDRDKEYIGKFLKENGISDNNILIGINIGATWPTRRWPLEYFAKLISLLLKEGDFRIIITATDKELDMAKVLQRLDADRIINATDKTDVGQLLALIKRCNLFISNDAGPMHLAAALHTPLIALFGPGHIIRYDPRRIWDKAVVFYKKAFCAPCIKVNCDSMACLKAISPEEVKEAAIKLL